MKKVLKWVGIGFVVLIVLAVLVSGGEESSTTSDSGSSTQSDTNVVAEEVSADTSFGLSEDVVVENRVRWNITSVENLGQTLTSSNQFVDSSTTTGKFIRVKGEIENVSTEQLTLSAPNLVDSNGRTFAPYNNAYSFVEENDKLTWFDTFNPNISRSFTEIYEVSADAEGLQFEATNLGMFNVVKANIDLGL